MSVFFKGKLKTSKIIRVNRRTIKYPHNQIHCLFCCYYENEDICLVTNHQIFLPETSCL
jgi:hypothetical protein